MQRFKLADWASVAEILASVFVIASLAYVGSEIQQNTEAMQNESHLSVITILSDQQLALTTDETLHRIFQIAEDTPESLSNEEWSRFVQFLYPRIGVWEYIYVARQRGAITDTVWDAFEPYFLSIICKPGYRRWWNEYGHSNAPNFVEYIEDQVLPTCDDSVST